MNLIENALYTVSDCYFTDFKSEFMVDNKNENRPFYYLFKDSQGVPWIIPLSTQVEAYKKKIEKDTKKYGNCTFYHIGKIAGKERVFLIGNMLPVSEAYIKKPYTINKKHYIVGDLSLIKQISKKSKKYLSMVNYGTLKPHLDIIKIKNSLLGILKK